MITLKIDNDEQTVEDQVLYMKSIIDRMEHGFTSGTNWDISGIDEYEEEEESAVDSMRGVGFDKISSTEGQNDAKSDIPTAMYEVDGSAIEVPTDKITEFMAQYPHARKLT